MNNLAYFKQHQKDHEQWKRQPLPQESWDPINGWLWLAAIGISWVVVGGIGYAVWYWAMVNP